MKRQRTSGWRDDPALAGGGALFEGGVHWVNFASSLGFTIRRVKAVRPAPGAGIERSMALLLEYREGPACAALLLLGGRVTPQGTSHLADLRAQGSLAFESNGLFVAAPGTRWGIHFPRLSDIQGRRAMFADFLEAWETRREPRMTLAHARRDLEIIEEAYRDATGSERIAGATVP